MGSGLVVDQKEQGVLTLHLPNEPLKTITMLKPASTCEPRPYQPYDYYTTNTK